MANQTIPQQIDNAQLVGYIILDHQHEKTNNTQHWVYGQIIDAVDILAICKYPDVEGYYLFYCDSDWVGITDTFHNTLQDAKVQAEFEFKNTLEDWIML